MKKHLLYLLICALIPTACLCAQTQVISGTLTDADGAPLIGATILIKGTNKGTVTDYDGRYSIEAPIGSILVFSYTGFGIREVLVSGGQRQSSPEQEHAGREIRQESHAEGRPGVISLDQATPGYIILGSEQPKDLISRNWPYWRNGYFPDPVFSVKYLSPAQLHKKYHIDLPGGAYVINPYANRAWGLDLRYSSSFAWKRPTALPELQKSYAQGRPENGLAVWRGPENSEPFSWGPPISGLEFDGKIYDYDRNGGLTTKGSGNSAPARVYNPYHFFRTGATAINAIDLKLSYRQKWQLHLGFDRLNEQGIVPGAKNRSDHVQLGFKKQNGDRLSVKYHLDLVDHQAILSDRGGNMAGLFYSVATTPPSFDNTDGIPKTTSAISSNAYTTATGQMRSYLPAEVANPYFLVHQNANSDQSNRLLQYVDLQLDFNELRLFSKLSYAGSAQQQQFSFLEPGLWDRPAISSRREHGFDNGYAQLGLNWSFYPAGNYRHRISTRLLGEMFYDHFEFQRRNTAVDGALTGTGLVQQIRRSSNVAQKISYNYDDIIHLDLQNAAYYSSTLSRSRHWNPSAGLSLRIDRWLGQGDFVSFAKVFSSFSRNAAELAVDYHELEFNSLEIPSTAFRDYFEYKELFYDPALQPETSYKFEAGSEISLIHGKLQATFYYYRFFRKQAIFPALSPTGWSLLNGADVSSRGIEGNLSYYLHTYPLLWTVEANFSRNRNLVQKLHPASGEIAIAGFTDIHKSLIEGRPVGVLVGTRYARNAAGEMIIGEDGYPLVDDQTGIIGDPNPDWTAGIRNNLTWKGLKLSFLITLQQGGDVWNGTQNVLNYHGTSAWSASLRQTNDYVFPGVAPDGMPNTKTVAFADPQQDVAQNRWVQYGLTGIAEEGIQKASWLRLQELSLGYSFPRRLLDDLHLAELRISAFGKNVLLFSRYRGADPATSLFGYAHGQGLDLFNLPSVRSFGLRADVRL